LLGRSRRSGSDGDDDVDIEFDELSGETRCGIAVPLAPTVLNDNVLSFDVSELAQALPERFIRGPRRDAQITDAPRFCPRLILLRGGASCVGRLSLVSPPRRPREDEACE
jgi:hypothetical protein